MVASAFFPPFLPTSLLLLLLLLLSPPLICVVFVDAGIPVPEQFFPLQKIDHFTNGQNSSSSSNNSSSGVWSQRYYTYGKHFLGPGYPIFVILGGEGGISPETGILYPFVADHLAKIHGGFVLQPEHRFYGKSQPIPRRDDSNSSNSDEEEEEDPRVKLFTSEQALHDAMFLLEHVRNDLGCSPSSMLSSPSSSMSHSPSHYCPVITVGGSYPGFLSAMARIVFPHVVDIAYAASAPMKFYAQETDAYAYYDHITNVAEQTVPGCSQSVKATLWNIQQAILESPSVQDMELLASKVGICQGSIPEYIFASHDDDDDDFRTKMSQELMMVIGYTFANDNMSSYPPGEETRLYKACQIFKSQDLSPTERVKIFLTERLHRYGGKRGPNYYSDGHQHQQQEEKEHGSGGSIDASSSSSLSCWNMMHQLPTGHNATISGGDWSGDGHGPDGESWDFQTCTLLVEAIGFSGESMFPTRPWTMDWLRKHCMARFGVHPRPYDLVNKFGFNDLVSNNVSRILFTNGLKVR